MIDILIPTYNRSEFLKKNILILDEQIKKDKLSNYYRILISDNRSEDDTWNILESLKDSVSVDVKIYRQEKNIGLEPNAVFLLKESSSDYVMYLGDDDYLPEGYLTFVVDSIKSKNVFCIIPGFSALFPNGDVNPSRNATFDIKEYAPGFESVCEVSNFGHQLSGLVMLRKSLYEEYVKNEKYRNIYPFIFFVSYCVLRGKSIYAPKYQVLVSQGNSKDWKYDNSGLLIDIFKNYKIAFPSDNNNSTQASLSFIKAQPWRLRVGYNPLNALKSFFHLVKSDEVDKEIKFALLWIYPALYYKGLIKLIRKKGCTN